MPTSHGQSLKNVHLNEVIMGVNMSLLAALMSVLMWYRIGLNGLIGYFKCIDVGNPFLGTITGKKKLILG